MTYLEVKPISNADEEADQPALSSEIDKAHHVYMLTNNKNQ